MPARGALANALLPHVAPNVRWYTGRVAASFTPTATTPLGDLWQVRPKPYILNPKATPIWHLWQVPPPARVACTEIWCTHSSGGGGHDCRGGSLPHISWLSTATPRRERPERAVLTHASGTSSFHVWELSPRPAVEGLQV